MLRIIHVEELERMLLVLPDLVRLQEQRSPDFPDAVGAWLGEVERWLRARNLFQAAAIAMLRSELVAARQGNVPTVGAYRGVPSRSRIRSGVAANVAQRAADIISAIVQENRPRFAEAEAVTQRMVAIALARGLVETSAHYASRTAYLLDLRNRLIQGELETAVLHLEGLVGPNDMFILLDRALALRNVVLTEVPASGAHGPSQTDATADGATPSTAEPPIALLQTEAR